VQWTKQVEDAAEINEQKRRTHGSPQRPSRIPLHYAIRGFTQWRPSCMTESIKVADSHLSILILIHIAFSISPLRPHPPTTTSSIVPKMRLLTSISGIVAITAAASIPNELRDVNLPKCGLQWTATFENVGSPAGNLINLQNLGVYKALNWLGMGKSSSRPS
jgi:hypothetical protein